MGLSRPDGDVASIIIIKAMKNVMSTEILQKQKTDIQQTYTNLIINDALWDRDKRIKFWSQNVKGQGHSG